MRSCWQFGSEVWLVFVKVVGWTSLLPASFRYPNALVKSQQLIV